MRTAGTVAPGRKPTRKTYPRCSGPAHTGHSRSQGALVQAGRLAERGRSPEGKGLPISWTFRNVAALGWTQIRRRRERFWAAVTGRRKPYPFFFFDEAIAVPSPSFANPRVKAREAIPAART